MIIRAGYENTRLLDAYIVYELEVLTLRSYPGRNLGKLVAEVHTSLYRLAVLFGIYEELRLTYDAIRSGESVKHLIHIDDLIRGIGRSRLLSVTEGRIGDPVEKMVLIICSFRVMIGFQRTQLIKALQIEQNNHF